MAYYGRLREGHIFPEMLFPNVEELRRTYLEISAQADFKSEFDQLLRDYVGRPTPLYYASRLSEKYTLKSILSEKTFVIQERIKSTIRSAKSWSQNDWENRIIAETAQDNMGLPPQRSVRWMGIQCVVYMGELDIKRQAPKCKARMKMLVQKYALLNRVVRHSKDATNEAHPRLDQQPCGYTLYHWFCGWSSPLS